nr:ISAs1 family transposase [Anaeromassilibacillus sp. Marseille-P3371]
MAGAEEGVERAEKYRDGEKTLKSETGERTEYRYYISSLKPEAETFRRAVRGHWSVESMHWQLDVTFREDSNTTLNKQAAQNQNIIRKWSLSILKMIELMKPRLSMKKKRFVISLRPIQYLEEVLAI